MKAPWTIFELQSGHVHIALLFSISKDYNYENTQSKVTILALCTLSHVALHLCKVSWKYLKRFLSYRADTILWQRYVLWQRFFFFWQTDGQGKNNMSPNPTGGRHNCFCPSIHQHCIGPTVEHLLKSRKFFLFLFFLFGFYGLSRLFHSFWAESIITWSENERSPRKITWPPASRTWLVSHVNRTRLEPTAVRWRLKRKESRL